MDEIKNNKIEEFLTRGVENIYPNRSFVESKLKKGEKLTMYLGIDPTGPTLHLGSAIVLKKLKEFQDLGHQVILLIGDFTAMIGDPTDKTATRKQLTKKEVLRNEKLFKGQISNFLSFKGRNKAIIKHNSKWFAKMRFGEVLDLASKMTVEQMLKRDMFDKRIKEGRPVYIHEFLYPLMQGYDSIVMDVDGEIGGNDQTFNMLAGRTLMKQMKNKEKFVITVKLLEDKDGVKMGKTEGNMASLSDTPQDMFGKIMSWSDGMISSGFELCTYVSMKEIKEIEDNIKKNIINPRDIKMKLAYEIIKIYYGEDGAKKAKQNFIETFQKKGTPDNIKEVTVEKDSMLIEVLIKEGLVSSKTDFRRLIKNGAIKLEDKQKIDDEDYKIKEDTIFKIGKRRFIKINIK